MMVTLNIPVERISEDARRLDPAKVALTILLALPFLLGLVARVVWLALAFLWSAALYGWQAGGSLGDLRRENDTA
jgi:hypothetical protein